MADANTGDAKQVPYPVEQGGERISERSYDSDFARLPADETIGHEPGGGPHGTVTSGRTNLPLVVMAVGFALLFVTFGVQHWWPLAAGLLLLLVGAMWAGARNRPLRLSKGTGPVEMPRGD